ncbi:cation:proton antiporter [Pseudomonas sp. NY11955]|uniref:cation:proton antiporter domain-containing protein n=1 Tax=Pseudomonas sp. NY11955 TaxID=3400363 RepID=UPI003A840C3E
MYSLIEMLLLVVVVCLVCRVLVSLFGQPAFVGDILTGFLVGSYFLGSHSLMVFPSANVAEFIKILRALGEIGLICILVEVIWCAKHVRAGSGERGTIIIIACFTIFVPFVVGAIVGYYSSSQLAFGYPVLGYVLFCGIAFSVTALPVLAMLIEQSRYITRSVGAVALVVAIYTDAFAWISLALLVVFLGGGDEETYSALMRFGCLALFMFCIVIIKMALKELEVGFGGNSPGSMLVIFIGIVLSAVLTESIGFHFSIGAIAAIYAFSHVPGIGEAWRKWQGNLCQIAVPLFFIGTGTIISFTGFNEIQLWLWFVVFLIAAVASKILSSYAAGLVVGMNQRESLELGILMSTKGTAELVVLSVGNSAGLLSDNSYAILLLLSVVSTLLTAPLVNLLNRVSRGRLQAVE